MEVLMLFVMGAVNVACFVIGAKVGQAVAKGERIETPSVDPFKAVKEHAAKKEAEMERHRMNVILQNIENYDGTSKGQEDVPGR